jgi:hypothetical protein
MVFLKLYEKWEMLEPIIASIVIALILTLLFSQLAGRSGTKKFRGAAGWVFFLILFFAMWAGGLWIYPAGPAFWGISWLPALFVGLATALLLSATDIFPYGTTRKNSPDTPALQNREDGEIVRTKEDRRREGLAISVFFWALLAILAVAIIAGYLVNSQT